MGGATAPVAESTPRPACTAIGLRLQFRIELGHVCSRRLRQHARAANRSRCQLAIVLSSLRSRPSKNKQGIEDEDDYENKRQWQNRQSGNPTGAGVVRDLHLTAHRLRRKNQQHQPPACSNVSAPPL